MNFHFRHILLILVIATCSGPHFVMGQTSAIPNMDPNEDATEEGDSLVVNLATYLPPLKLLVDSAIANAPQVEYFLQRQKMFEYEEAATKKEWLDNIQFSANYFDGTATAVAGQLNFGGLNYGIGVRIPLGMLFTQADRVKMARASSLSEQAKREEQERLIIQEVEETYSKLFMLKNLIEVATEARESARFIYEQSETRFVRGELSLDELGQNTELKSKWATNYINLKNEFYVTFRKLQRLVGVPFSKFNLD